MKGPIGPLELQVIRDLQSGSRRGRRPKEPDFRPKWVDFTLKGCA